MLRWAFIQSEIVCASGIRVFFVLIKRAALFPVSASPSVSRRSYRNCVRLANALNADRPMRAIGGAHILFCAVCGSSVHCNFISHLCFHVCACTHSGPNSFKLAKMDGQGPAGSESMNRQTRFMKLFFCTISPRFVWRRVPKTATIVDD